VRFVFLVLAACGAAPRPAPVVASRAAHTCADAAVGLERATKGVRPPDTTVFEAMRTRCTDDAWPVAAVECFATMREGELATCAQKLREGARDGLFGVLGGEQGSLELARARLDALDVPVAECAQFVHSVRAVLTCEQMPLPSRVQLGNETADFWSLPADLPADAQQRIANACGASLARLRDQATGLGCML
jgi:hypothetical protein